MKPVLYCVAADEDSEAALQSWRRRSRPDLELVVDRPPPGAGASPPALAARMAAAVDGRDHALLAYGPATALLYRALPLMRTLPRCRRVFLVGAAPPDRWRPGDAVWPVSVMCAADDPQASPVAVAGWRRGAADSFSIQVFEGGSGLLRHSGAAMLESLLYDLGIRQAQALRPAATTACAG